MSYRLIIIIHNYSFCVLLRPLPRDSFNFLKQYVNRINTKIYNEREIK